MKAVPYCQNPTVQLNLLFLVRHADLHATYSNPQVSVLGIVY
jgi:hypothetical protein